MKISYNWIKQFLSIDWPAEKTGEVLTDLGLEVEGLESFISIPGGLKGVVVGEVLTCKQHPNADRLKLTEVSIGEDKPLQIVCGAPNVAVGQKVAVATVGSKLITAEGEEWEIKKTKIRGEKSHGMICSEVELHIGSDSSGILVLSEDAIVGEPLDTIYEVEEDQVFEIGLTPNRADAMSHLGVARDLSVGLQQKEISLKVNTPSISSFRIDQRTRKIAVKVEDAEKAPRYAGVTISGVKVGESPTWLQNRLKAIDIAPINNVVDVTNYVLHELGQPLHAFDVAKIAGDEINVKTLEEGTKFTTLDGVERTLNGKELMICDAEKPMAIAGVFGGQDSGVTSHTSDIFLESAYFDPITIRKASKYHGLNTDASFRFERGVDPNITEYALMRAANLIKKVAGGEVTSDIVDLYPKKIDDHQVFINYKNIKRIVGEEIPEDKIKGILSGLEIKINNATEAGLGVTIPAYRNDVVREVDVVEEILRVYGYNKIAIPEKLRTSTTHAKESSDFKLENTFGDHLVSLGFTEMLANSLSSPEYTELVADLDKKHNVELLNPLSKELSIMRQSLLFGGLEALAYNANRRVKNLKLFEFGKTYHKYPNKRVERKRLSIVLSGNKTPENWSLSSKPTDFFYLKGIVYSLLEKIGITQVVEKETKSAIFSEGLELQKNKQTIVELGLVQKNLSKAFDIDKSVYFANIYWEELFEIAKGKTFTLQSIPKYPKVKRDLALLLDESVRFEDLRVAAKKVDTKLLKEVSLFDVYTGDSLPKGKKSYALTFTILDTEKTLTDKQIDKLMKKLQKTFEKDFGASLRQ
ncbi:MAG TPA: phenylalanine--tRNA ligase subunit beta [Flavobacteriaceae bacterium]|nr:phenylalanine--tRNA ligase subunit beta [Flavobacteriaceae bacterium]